MDLHLIICLVIFVLAIISFCMNKLTMGTTAMLATLAFVLTGCLDGSKAVSFFGNTSAILVMAMSIVSAGFSRTQFVDTLARRIGALAKGNITRICFGYVVLAAILSQLVSSPTTVFCVIAPLVGATVDGLGLSRSKIMFPVGVTCIATCGILPMGAGISQVAKINTFLEAAELDYVCELTDMTKVRFPLLIATVLYCSFIAPRFCPDKPETAIVAATEVKKKEPLPALQEKLALVIFFGCTIALVFAKQIGIPVYIIAMTAAMLMVLAGVLKPKEATAAIPLWLYFLIVGSMAISAALVDTGAGALLGGIIAEFGRSLNSEFLLYLLFFLAPFLVTQVMQNNATVPVFLPIVIEACVALGVNPVGPCIVVYAGILGSIMTPMATATVSQYMGEGGYTLGTTVKMSILPSIMFAVVTVVSAMVVFPLY